MVWNVGAIARSGHPRALHLVRRILLASSAMPGIFAPAMVNVTVDGEAMQEMHVDGGAVAQAFLYPSSVGRARRERIARGTAALPHGRHSIVFEWRPEASGPPIGRGGVGTLSVNGQQVAERRMERSIPFHMQWDEAFDVGQDTGTPVDDRDDQVPFAFIGTLRRLQFNLGASTLPQAAARN